MFGRKRKTPVVPDDISEAKSRRVTAEQELRELQNQSGDVSRLSSRLTERRALNHFGESIQITFTRRGHA